MQGSRRSRRLVLGACLALLAVVAPRGLAAQAAEEATLTGVVVDAGSGARIPGASVAVATRPQSVFSNQDGRFVVPHVGPGTHTVVVAQIGYDTLRTEIQVGPAGSAVTLRMTPDPVELERVTALVDRFEARRNALGTSVRAFGQDRLRTSPAMDALEFVRSRGSLRPIACPSRTAMGPCAWVRGRPVEVQVFIDGAPMVGGLDVLASFRPDELYTLEVIGGGRAVRAYTTYFVELVAEGRRVPNEVFF